MKTFWLAHDSVCLIIWVPFRTEYNDGHKEVLNTSYFYARGFTCIITLSPCKNLHEITITIHVNR